ncbi:Uncharacterised protein [Klebsiella pneumoniae]|nr:Uncharacterised protein [Klebsiella pneumoniae]SLW07886.1 Uncharacterised protein [Klebsiella pneumoniae]
MPSILFTLYNVFNLLTCYTFRKSCYPFIKITDKNLTLTVRYKHFQCQLVIRSWLRHSCITFSNHSAPTYF